MKTAAAYLLAKLGGVAEPTAGDIARILGSGTFLCHAFVLLTMWKTFSGIMRGAGVFAARDASCVRANRGPAAIPRSTLQTGPRHCFCSIWNPSS